MNPYAQSMALGSARAGAARFITQARRFPMVEPQEEYMLAKRWRQHGDTAAAHRLVTSHLRLVGKIALGYRGYGLPIADVISEGNVGLMQAVKRFDPDRGFRLTTYAMWWIRASIQEFILRSRSLVRIGTTANQKKLFFSLRKAKSKISALEEGDMRPDQVKLIANDLGVPEQEVIDMNRRLAGDASLNAPIRDDGDSGESQDWLVDEAASPERAMVESEELGLRRKALGKALGVLNHRERRIFDARRLAEDPITLEELADELGVSRERVRQIETGAFEKVRHRVIHLLGAAQTKATVSWDTCFSLAVERGAEQAKGADVCQFSQHNAFMDQSMAGKIPLTADGSPPVMRSLGGAFASASVPKHGNRHRATTRSQTELSAQP
jgi:RNA polymerase sigma-32 factor